MGNKLKELEKCKHPNSRKTIALTKQIKKASKREKAKMGQTLKVNITAEKYIWFKERIEDNVTCCSAEQTHALVTQYLNRFSNELEQIKLKHSIGMRKNRQHANREDILNMSIKREEEEFNGAGIEIPDIMNPKHLELLQKWGGEPRFLQNLKCRRFCRKFLQAEMDKCKNSSEPVINSEVGNISTPEVCME